jgi:hypothetical protein
MDQVKNILDSYGVDTTQMGTAYPEWSVVSAAGKEEAALFSGAPGQPSAGCEVFFPVAASPSETKLIKIGVFI